MGLSPKNVCQAWGLRSPREVVSWSGERFMCSGQRGFLRESGRIPLQDGEHMPGAPRLSEERFGGLWSHRVGTLGGYHFLACSFPMPETSPRATVSPGGF